MSSISPAPGVIDSSPTATGSTWIYVVIGVLVGVGLLCSLIIGVVVVLKRTRGADEADSTMPSPSPATGSSNYQTMPGLCLSLLHTCVSFIDVCLCVVRALQGRYESWLSDEEREADSDYRELSLTPQNAPQDGDYHELSLTPQETQVNNDNDYGELALARQETREGDYHELTVAPTHDTADQRYRGMALSPGASA
jgi:hypothetical protein